MKDMSKAWYLWESWEGDFYSLYPPDNHEYVPIPHEYYDRTEIADYLNNIKAKTFYDRSKIAVKYKSYGEPDTKENAIELPSGFYQFVEANDTPHYRLVPVKIRDDMFIKSDGIYNEILDEFKSFINNEELYRKLEIIYKRSILMYGSPGMGKTAIIRQIIKNEIPKEAVVIFFSESPDVSYATKIASTLSNRMKILVFEELITMLADDFKVQEFLNFMDGEKSLDKAFIFGTTNYPEKLPENIVNRPSRWDRVIKMKGLNKDGKAALIKHILERDVTEEELNLVENLSTAAIKEVCFMVRLHSVSFKESVDKMNNHVQMFKNEFVEKGKLGL